ncbi:hypothetical protein Q3G72_026250 [Acer saccharum]|nr:hypothetical protein Q3G72_026250 [Acer saccharum]
MDRSQFADQEELNLNEWEQIQSPSPSPSLNIIPATPPRELDMVAIRDSYLQDSLSLQVSSQPNSPPSSSPSSSSSSSDVSSSNLRDRVAVNEVGRQLSLRLKILRSGIVRIAAKIRYCAAVYVGGFWSFAAMTGLVATVLLSLLYTRLRRKVRQVENNNNGLIFLIKEKDQKINQLLLQVSQMNELLSRRRKVTVIRIGRAKRPEKTFNCLFPVSEESTLESRSLFFNPKTFLDGSQSSDPQSCVGYALNKVTVPL